MKHLGKTILTAALAACTAFAVSCAGGEGGGSGTATKTPASPSSAAGGNTANPEQTPAPAEIPEGAKKWIAACDTAQSILMTTEQIQKMNAQMRSKCDALTDIASYPNSIAKSKLKALIEGSSGPSLPKYDESGKQITQADLDAILENRNLDALQDTNTARKGILVQKCDVRALPTAREFYDKASVQDHDRMQETSLNACSPVWILHTSQDGKFYFIQSYYYVGWVDANNVADAEECGEWNTFTALLDMQENASKDRKFVIVTDGLLQLENGVKLEMGTALPLSKTQTGNDKYTVMLPVKDSQGKVQLVDTDLDASSVHEGYLPYTYENFYIQAFRYIGTPYGWGGMKDGVDCSSYVLNVFKTFGFVFPRNTSQQNKAVGNITNVEGKSDSDKISLLKNAEAPVLIYKSGHVMIYLGEMDGTQYIIHAPGGGKVREDAYDGFSSLIRICDVGPLK